MIGTCIQYVHVFVTLFSNISQDIAFTKALEESLKPYGIFETEEELQHRLLVNF